MDIASALAKVTVVVPVGPGDAISPRLRAQLAALSSQVRVVHAQAGPTHQQAPPDEAGARTRPSGSLVSDDVDADADAHRWQVIDAPRGRAAQQNAGARDASSDWLWFLHADSVLATDTVPALARFIDANDAQDAVVVGYFDLRFIDDGPALMRLTALGVWLRSHWLGLPFGDQGLVLPRAVFERLGGFNPALDCGEDHDLVWRLRRAKVPLRPVGAALFTSARKYAERGWWSTTGWHLRETWRQVRRFSRREPVR